MIHQVNIGESINYKMEIDDSEENIIVSIALSRLFWKLRFNLGSKGTYYLGRAILLAYINQELTFNNKELMHIIALENNTTDKSIRSDIDNSINSMFRISTPELFDNFFKNIYDGRKPSTKYFIILCINYLNSVTGKHFFNINNLI